MTGNDLRSKFLKFFEQYPNLEHRIIPSAPLIPSEEEQLEGKEKVLFTSAGMQPLIPYLMGKDHAEGKRLADVQKCLRTDDIEEVGDFTHHTFFEMLGNWSLGDYWKKEAIEMSFYFLTRELEIPVEKLAVSVFAGDEDAPKDEESAKVWKDLGISEERISYLGKEHNWWPTSRKDPVTGEFKNAYGPCGPDTEMFYWTGEGEPEGRPETDDRWVEIWNDVFMQYNRSPDGQLTELPRKNVDTGMGLERTFAVLSGQKDNYKTDLFTPIFDRISEYVNVKYGDDEQKDRNLRIIADHIKAATFLINEGVIPSNKLHGYILRRLLRRSAVKLHQIDANALDVIPKLVDPVIDIYQGAGYFEIGDWDNIRIVVEDEIKKFRQTLSRGLKEIEKINQIDGKIAFDLYQSFGFPLEITEELFKQKGQRIDHSQFEAEFRKHQEASRTASAGKFAGGLAGHSETEIKYHTATHLLHQALRDILGQTVFQKGSNITPERLRFDFSFDRKLTDEEISLVEKKINDKIKQDLKVDRMYMTYDEAKSMNAIGLFDEKYDKSNVSIYAIGPSYVYDRDSLDLRERKGYYSLEFCGGPHVEHTGVIGGIKITKEEAVSAGMRRIRAELA